MSEIKLGGDSVFAGMERIARDVDAAVAGFERAMAVIEGICDSLLFVEDVCEKWHKQSFDLRVNEIEHLRNLGRISVREEAELWKELFNEKKYGWKNAQTAEENYYKCLYESSKNWIEEQTQLGKMSAQEVAQAWKEVYQSFDDVNIKYQAALNIRKALLGETDAETAERRSDSDRWMKRQILYGGDASEQINAYSRRIETERQLLKEIESGFLNGVELGAAEKEQRWREVYKYIEDLEDERYKTAKQYIQQQAEDYIREMRTALDEDYNYRLKLYNNELSELNDSYNEKRRRRKEAERNDELCELFTLKNYYKDAVTKEGQEKYKDILSKISDIYYDQQEDDDREKYEEDQRLIKNKIARLKEEYEKSKADLERSGNDILSKTGQIVSEGISAASSAGNNINNIMIGLNRSFSSQIESIYAKTEQYLNGQVTKIAQLFDKLGLYSKAVGSSSKSSDTNVTVTLNDYGDKNLSSNDSVVGYANELIYILQNTLRSQGVK